MIICPDYLLKAIHKDPELLAEHGWMKPILIVILGGIWWVFHVFHIGGMGPGTGIFLRKLITLRRSIDTCNGRFPIYRYRMILLYYTLWILNIAMV